MSEKEVEYVAATVEYATISKLLAESRKLESEAAVNVAELDSQAALAEIAEKEALAELRTAEANAREAEYNAVIARVNHDATLRAEGFTLASDHYHHEYIFDQRVDEKSVDKALQQLEVWHRQDAKCPMTIRIRSGGGEAMAGMHLFDELSAYSLRGGGTHEVKIKVRGYAASMAGILVQAADVRLMGPQAYLMIHEVASGAVGKVGELKTEVKFLELMCAKVVDIFLERSKGKVTREEFERNWQNIDWWLDANESLRLGFVDGIG